MMRVPAGNSAPARRFKVPASAMPAGAGSGGATESAASTGAGCVAMAGADDVVVSFNKCVLAELLCARSVNLFVHGFNAPDAYFFGLPYGPEVQRIFRQPDARCFTMLVGCTGAMCPLPQVALYWERIPLPALWNYPVERPGGKRYVGPTTGFNALVLFDWLRRQEDYHFQLMTLGFSNEAGKRWSGHAWDYERDWLLKSDVTVIPLQRRRWWQKLFHHS